MPTPEDWKLYEQKRNWYERNEDPGHRAAIEAEFASRRAYTRMPIHGEVLEAFKNGRLEIGEGSHFEPHVWITLDLENAHIRIGRGVFLNLGVMIAAQNEITIGDHTMIANGCFVGDALHRYDDPNVPITHQGFTSKGPVRIGSNCWLGINVVVTSGVTIGDRCVIGANSVVTSDIPAGSIAAGAPAKVIREIEFKQ
ncbi:MAG TPA: acyltransferase [Solirubrobacterales bacterium]|jgi:acetyltransferase-like isoleucine patch superfamily enzyme|nr:acyltransferase [Solirubrobacterales bacterium]